MTIETISLRNDYVGNGSQTVFAFTFKVLFEVAESPAYSIQVITTDLLGVETVKTQITDYTVTLNSDNTGTITFSTAPITGHKITLLRSMSKTQRADYVNAGTDKFPGNVHELALDKLTLICQEYLERFNRVITLPKNSLLLDIEFPIDATRADQVLAINSAGNNLTTKNLADVGLAPITNFIKTLFDDIDAATARNTLSAQAQSANLSALAALAGAANKIPYFTGAGTMALADFEIPVGTIFPLAGSVLPGNFLACNGAAISRSTYANLFAALVTADNFSAQTFTVTIASPGVFTKSSHNFLGGERIRLSTTGALPTGLTTGTDYFVVYVSSSTFQLSSTLGGPSINTSGSQSGTHSYTQSRYGLGDGSTTFNLPDLRDQFLRGYSPTRALGTGQLDAFQGHGHSGIPKDALGGPVSAFAYGGGTTQTAQSLITLVTDGVNGTPRAANETRPVNIALNYCIKY